MVCWVFYNLKVTSIYISTFNQNQNFIKTQFIIYKLYAIKIARRRACSSFN